MHLFCKETLNAVCTFNNTFSKLKVYSDQLRLVCKYTSVKKVKEAESNNEEVMNRGVKKKQFVTFENFISKRRIEAKKSILVQVQSANSNNDLYNYCSEFGQIVGMHHFMTAKKQYIIVEFQKQLAVDCILSKSSFPDGERVIPVRTSMLWFRNGRVRKTTSTQAPPLNVINGTIMPTNLSVIKNLQSAHSISQQIKTMYDLMKLQDIDIRLRFLVAGQVNQCFTGLFPNLSVHPFGSSVNGFGKRSCDLDLVLSLDNNSQKPTINRLTFQAKTIKLDEKQNTKELLGIVADTMQHLVPGIKNVIRILQARIPIIRFRHSYTGIETDLGVSNQIGIYMSELLYIYGEMDDRVRPLVFIIRKWAQNQGLTNKNPGGWITNFSLTLLVIFYLQQKKIIPIINVLEKYAESSDMRYADDAIDCTFLRDITKLPSHLKSCDNESLEDLLRGFFEFYGNVDFSNSAISLRSGTFVAKPNSGSLYICNPLERSLNVSKNVSHNEIARLKMFMIHGAAFFQEKDMLKSRSRYWGILSLLNIEKLVSKEDALKVENIFSMNNENRQVYSNLE